MTRVRPPGIGWSPVVRASDLTPGEGAIFRVLGVPIAVYRTATALRAVGARCPHAGSLLSEFATEQGTALCPSHGWEFHLTDGRCTSHPTSRVPVFRAVEHGGYIWVFVRPAWAALAAWTRTLRGTTMGLAERLR